MTFSPAPSARSNSSRRSSAKSNESAARNSSNASGEASITKASAAFNVRVLDSPRRRLPSRISPKIATSLFSATSSKSPTALLICLLSSGTVNSAIYEANSSAALVLSALLGINRHPISATNAKPAMAVIPPTGAKSNILNGSPRLSSRIVAMIIFGGVPISVAMPPRIVANDKAIRDSPGERPALRAV